MFYFAGASGKKKKHILYAIGMALEFNFTPFPTLSTPSLILREVTMEDAPALMALRTDIACMQYIGKPKPQSIEEIYELIRKVQQGIEQNDGIGWAMELKDGPGMIGMIGYHRTNRDHHRAEIGYQLLPAYWRRGLMNEAIKAVLDYGFNQMNLHSVEAVIDPNNQGSAAILKKNNFVREGYFKEDYFFNGRFLDSEIYSLLTPLNK